VALAAAKKSPAKAAHVKRFRVTFALDAGGSIQSAIIGGSHERRLN